MPNAELIGKTVIVTGASKGLGRAIAAGLVDSGATVAICDLDGKALETTASDIRAGTDADRVFAAACDISDETATAQFVDSVITRFGKIDGLINNAGLGGAAVRPDFMSNPVPIWNLEPGEWRRVIEVNTTGTFLMTRWATPHMVRAGAGRIINITTTFQTMLAPSFGAYGPSKAGIEAMTSILVEELENTGVTVNVLVPGGPADTGQFPDGMIADRSKLLRPEVMVPPAVFLCSDESAHISGRRFAAAQWNDALPLAERLDVCTEPVAWRQLVEPLVTTEGVTISTSRGAE